MPKAREGQCQVCMEVGKVVRLYPAGLMGEGKSDAKREQALLSGVGPVDVCWPKRDNQKCLLELRAKNPEIHFEPQDDDLSDFWTY